MTCDALTFKGTFALNNSDDKLEQIRPKYDSSIFQQNYKRDGTYYVYDQITKWT